MTGAGLLLRAFLRRDRWMIFWWVLAGVLLYWTQAISVAGLYATQEEFDTAAELMGSNPALIAMAGPDRALNTVGGQVAWQSTAFGAILAGLMSMFLAGRHTRAEEESGRDELLRAGVVGRRATTSATVGVLLVANALLAVGIAVSLVTVPLAVADSVALGVGVALCGMLFGGVALVAAQLTASTRTAYALTGVVIAAAYALRAVGDLGRPTLTWLSPIGWYQQMYAFSGLRWWPAVLLLLAGVLALVGAYAVLDRRDWGAGVLATRPGTPHASAALGTPVGLAWRLQRGAVVGWGLGLFAIGLSYGSIGNDAGDLIGDSEAARQMMVAGGGDLVAGFYAMSMTILALMAAGFAISSATRARGEEEAGHGEAVLATARSRTEWLAAHVSVTVGGTVLVLGLGGLGLGLADALVTGEGSSVWQFTWQTLAWLPAVLALTGLTRLLYGVRGRLATLGWLGLAFAVVVLVLGEILRFPDWLRGFSPFEHLARMPVEDFDPGSFGVVLGVAALLSFAGWFTFRRRDFG
ncbi:ABC transporter membrane-spanning protein [Nocardioides aestuarii]|uniref:ABC transporter permease n=1 Tax=Nocardioides aestuarii TaxID=252231 RepID=A0ABW4TUU2_9ACTN